MEGRHSAEHIAALAAYLPSDSCVYKARSEDARWSLDSTLLAALLNSLNALIYGLGDAKRRGNPPKLVGPSYMAKDGKRSLEAMAMTADELMDVLSKPRR